MGICAYCGEDGSLTREHIFPRSIMSFYPEHEVAFHDEPGKDRAFPLGIEKQVIKDVCNTCNNNKLQQLDNYGVEFFQQYFLNNPYKSKINKIRYNYNYLSKWLLKIVYNSIRTYRGRVDDTWFRQNSKYFISEAGSTTSPITISAAYYSDVVPIKIMDRPMDVRMKPQLFPNGFYTDKEPLKLEGVINTYLVRLGYGLFLIFIWGENVEASVINDSTLEFNRLFPYTTLLPFAEEVNIEPGTDMINGNVIDIIHGYVGMNMANAMAQNSLFGKHV